tara:strand:+ start:385 stop:1950 length:1566 start_codon:yes stop_codon:yes gene_type:complete
MISKLFSHKDKIFILLLFLFAVFFNQYYGNKGIFPMDSAHFFDSGFRVLNGDIPFIDYWLVKGPLLDYIQAFFFGIFGVNWQTYILHASIFNGLIAVSTFLVLKNFQLENKYCFLFSFLISILAYPSSGTPFIDHHSAFFCLLAVYSLLLAIKKQEKIYWVLVPILLIFGFLSKQVPTVYFSLSLIIILALYFLILKKFQGLKYMIISFFSFIILILVFGKFQGITFSSFFIQHILFPQTIGSLRLVNLNISIDLIEKFILIIIPIMPLLYLNFKKIINFKKYKKDNNLYFFLILLFYTISLIFHQIMTKNQTFIFFLIPLVAAFSHIELSRSKIKLKKQINILIILICIFATFKYHLRFNEGRKFHELKNANFNLAVDALSISKKLSGLKWISPRYKENPKKEVLLINTIKNTLIEDKRKKMLISNYPFFSIILNEKLFSPSRVYTGDGTTHPIKGNKYEEKYKELIKSLVLKNDISVIYITKFKYENINFHYIDDLFENCSKEKIILEQLSSYNIENCN